MKIVILESNQNHAQVYHNQIVPALPAAMGMGGGYIPMIVTYDDEETDDADGKEVL